MKHALPFVLAATFVLGACRSEADRTRERADDIEKVYGLAPADARVIATEHKELAERSAQRDFERAAERLGMKRLWLDDVPAFSALVGAKSEPRLLDRLCDDRVIALVAQLRDCFGYEPRFREAEQLADAAEKGTLNAEISAARASRGEIRSALEALAKRAPLARLPLAGVKPAVALGPIQPARIDETLRRFSALEIGVGVHELEPHALELLTAAAKDEKQADALSAAVRFMPAMQVARVETGALAQAAPIGSTALGIMLERLGPTRAFHGVVAFEPNLVRFLQALAPRPQAAGLLSILEDANPDFMAIGTPAEAQALVRIDAAAPEGRARETLAGVLRARVGVDALDDPQTAFLVALMGKSELREAVTAVHSAFGGWRPGPADLPALELLAGAPDVGPVARALRTLGYDVSGRPLGKDEAASLASLGRASATQLVEGLHAVVPRLTVRTPAALAELDALAKAGVTREDVLRLDADSLSGPLDAAKRALIVERVHKAG